MGGEIGLLQEGDIIEIDIPASKLNVRLSEEELQVRRNSYVAPENNVSGWLNRYRKLVTGADKGAVLE